MDHGSILGRSGAACAVLLTATLMSPAAAQEGEDTDAADAANEPRACLPQPQIRRTKILNDRNIVFITRHDEIFNVELPKQCPSLNRRSLVNYPITSGRLCAGDRFQVLWEVSPGNFIPSSMCELGAFVPITETELEDLTAMTDQTRERRSRRSTREAVTTEKIELPPETSAPPAPESASAE